MVLVQAAFFFSFAAIRIVDGDEGVYALTSVLVMRGKMLYQDLFYPQMPVLPYVYGAWMQAFGESWYAARFLSALFATATGTLLFAYLARRRGHATALVGVTLFASTYLVFTWFTTVKSYAISTFLLFTACVLLEGGRSATPRFAAAGVLFALAFGTRLYFVAALPTFLVAVLRSPQRRAAATAFAGGAAIGLVPTLVYFVLDPQRFLWNVLGYQGVRSSGGLVGDLTQKADVARTLVGFGAYDRAAGVQYLVLCGGAAIALVALLHTRRPIPLSFVAAACVAGASFLPTPTYTQYFCVTVPFLILGTLDVVGGSLRVRENPASWWLICAAVAGIFILGAETARRHVTWAQETYPVDHPVSTIGAVRDVTRFINAHASRREQVMASWPGYLLGSHATVVPRLEEHFAPPTAAAVSSEEIRRYRLITAREVEALIHSYRTRLVVYHNWLSIGPRPDWRRALREARYRPVALVGDAIIYEAPRIKVPSEVFRLVRRSATRSLARVDFRAALASREVIGGGDARARGRIDLSASNDPAQVCWALEIVTLGSPTGVVLRRAGRGGTKGPIVARLGQGFSPDGCTNVNPSIAAEFLSAPSSFYVAVTTRVYPHGAARGTPRSTQPMYRFGASQRGLPGDAHLSATLVGYPAVLGADPDGFAAVELHLERAEGGSRVCWAFVGGQARGRPLRAELRVGKPAPRRRSVLRLGREFTPRGCATVPPRLAAALRANPRRYHVAISTAAYPAGAVLGALTRP